MKPLATMSACLVLTTSSAFAQDPMAKKDAMAKDGMMNKDTKTMQQ